MKTENEKGDAAKAIELKRKYRRFLVYRGYDYFMKYIIRKFILVEKNNYSLGEILKHELPREPLA